MAAAEQTFQELVAQLDYPMFIATVAADDERAGCLIGFATQCSIHPPRFLAGISDKNHTHRVAQRTAAMGIHLVPEDATELAELFGGETGDELDKFERCSWSSATTRAWFSSRSSPRARSLSEIGISLF
jgi:flavin reductase (DIM6/NTAB) family NADH-FMN oxidoreductase RutF